MLGVSLWAARPGVVGAQQRTFTIDYQAPDRCPDRSAFANEVTRRTHLARLAAAAEQPEIVLRVRLSKRARQTVGKLEITIGTATSERALEADACEELVSALAFVAALAIDPLAQASSELPPLPLPPDPHVPRDMTDRPHVPLPGGVGVAEAYVGLARAKTPRASELELTLPPALPAFPYHPTPRRPSSEVEVGPGAHFAFDYGPSPQPLVGVAGLFGVRALAPYRWSLRAELTYSASLTDARAGGVEAGDPVSVRMLRGRVEGCFPGYEATPWLRLWPCADFGGGALWAEVSRSIGGLVQTKEGASPWVVGGLAGKVELAPVEWLGLEVRAGPDFPLVKGSFKDERGQEIFTAAPVTLSLGVGLTTAF